MQTRGVAAERGPPRLLPVPAGCAARRTARRRGPRTPRPRSPSTNSRRSRGSRRPASRSAHRGGLSGRRADELSSRVQPALEALDHRLESPIRACSRLAGPPAAASRACAVGRRARRSARRFASGRDPWLRAGPWSRRRRSSPRSRPVAVQSPVESWRRTASWPRRNSARRTSCSKSPSAGPVAQWQRCGTYASRCRRYSDGHPPRAVGLSGPNRRRNPTSVAAAPMGQGLDAEGVKVGIGQLRRNPLRRCRVCIARPFGPARRDRDGVRGRR